jgi:CubicO group peptidase (beta-lactamase class C family)
MFGEMVRRRGWFNGKQIMPAQVVDDILKNADNARFDQESYPNLKGWGYRDMWWVTNNADKAFCARGVYGQTIYIDMAAEMVLVRLASMPVASNAANDPYSLPAYQAVADYLMEKY